MEAETSAVTDVPAWMIDALPWALGALLLVAFAGALAAWMLVAHARALDQIGRRLDVLEDLKTLLKGLASDREDIDLRRLEHVVVDIRDGQKRTEDVLLRAVEKSVHEADVQRRAASSAEPGAPSGPSVGERVVNRLLAMDYERVQIVSPLDDLTLLAEADGEVLVEAHRHGVLHKGRVLVRGGALADVELSPAYTMFP